MPTTLDCLLLRDLFGSARMREIFDTASLLEAWLEAEAALAEAEAECGVVPGWAAEGIRAAVGRIEPDLDRLRAGIADTGHPLVPLLRALQHEAGDAGAYVHWGATTQDIIDTGTVLQVRSALDVLEAQVDRLAATLAGLASRHRTTPMAGRTHGQHAVPITLGLKVATWLAELMRDADRLTACRGRVLVAELGGAAGTLATLGPRAADVRRAFCRRLALGEPAAPWFASRDGLAELVAGLASLAALLERIAREIARLQSTEIAELSEPLGDAHVGSSTMPQKRNPMVCEYVAATCKLVRGLEPVMTGCLVGEHERDMATWAAEWLLVPQALIMTGGALEQLAPVLADLRVDEERMRANLGLTQGAIASEALMQAAAAGIGRERAHELLREVTREAARGGGSVAVAAATRPELAALFEPGEIERLLDPLGYPGESADVVDGVLARHAAWASARG